MRRPAVLMTDPRYFAIRGGANPHTRNPDDSLKVVDIDRAWPQWHAYVDAPLDGGIDVYVAAAGEDPPRMVFSANAGFLEGRTEQKPSSEKTFYPSHFTAEHRRPEGAAFSRFMERFGFPVDDYPEEWRFEGEADAFPVGRGGEQQWVFTWGFRSDRPVADWLEEEVIGQSIGRYRLADPRFYHGDTCLFELGDRLAAWPEVLEEESAAQLREDFGDRLLELPDEDGENFIGNSFYVETEADRLLYTPAEISEPTRARVESGGIDVIPIDISEFFGKGGGGPKCMVFNLGCVDPEESGLTDEERALRRGRHVDQIRAEEYFPA